MESIAISVCLSYLKNDMSKPHKMFGTLPLAGFVDDAMFADNRRGRSNANMAYTQCLTRGQNEGRIYDVYNCLVELQ